MSSFAETSEKSSSGCCYMSRKLHLFLGNSCPMFFSLLHEFWRFSFSLLNEPH